MENTIVKKNIDEEGPISDDIRIFPKTIVFQRLVNTGNYENLKVGGEYGIPEGMSHEEARKQVYALVEAEARSLAEVFKLNRYDEYEHTQVEKLAASIRRYRQTLDQIQPNQEMFTGQIASVCHSIGAIQEFVSELNYRTQDAFRLLDKLLTTSKIDTKTLHFKVPALFTVEIVAQTDDFLKEDTDWTEDAEEWEDDD